MTTKTFAPVKIPMGWAAAALAEMCDAIDAGAEPSDVLVQVFHDRKLELRDAVDRRIAFFQVVKGQIDAAKAARNAYAEQAKRLEALLEAMKARTKEIIEEHPDLPYEGDLGKLCVQKSPPAVKVMFEDRTLDKETIDLFGISERFIRTKVTYELDTKAVKAAIEAGEDIPWARIEQGTHLRVRP